jgi:hypothetical protein
MYDPRCDDAREHDDAQARVYDQRDRAERDPRDGLMHDLDLPSGDARELVVDRDRVYELNGEDSRILAAVGAFRVVPEQDLGSDRHGRLRYVPLTVRLATALREHRHLRSARVLCRKSAAVSADVVKHYVERAAQRARLSASGASPAPYVLLASRGGRRPGRPKSWPATRI